MTSYEMAKELAKLNLPLPEHHVPFVISTVESIMERAKSKPEFLALCAAVMLGVSSAMEEVNKIEKRWAETMKSKQ